MAEPMGLWGQEPFFYQLNEDHRIPSMEMYDVETDNNGILWVACEEGLYKLNGNSYQLYRAKGQQGKAILGLSRDKYGRIWCSNYSNQLFYLDPGKDSLFCLDINSGRTPRVGLINWQIDDDRLYVSRAFEEIFYINLKTLEPSTVGRNALNFQVFPFAGKLFTISLGMENSWLSWPVKSGKDSLKLPLSSLEYVKLDNGQGFFRSRGSNKLYTFNKNLKVVEHPLSAILSKQSSSVVNLFQYQQYLFVLLYDGIMLFENTGKEFTFRSHFLKGKKAGNMCRDREGNFWITTTGNGLYVIPDIQLFATGNKASQGLPEQASKGIALNDSVVAFVFNNKELRMLNVPNNRYFKTIPLPFNYDVEAIALLDPNHIYISQYYSYTLDIRNGGYQKIKPPGNLKDIKALSSSQMLAASTVGVSHISLSGPLPKELPGGYTHYARTKEFPRFSFYRFARARSLFIDSIQQFVYFGFLDDLYYCAKGSMHPIRDTDGKEIMATSFARSVNGIIYATTSNKGIVLVKGSHVLRAITTNEGLPENNTQHGCFDVRGNFWFSCRGSVFRLSPYGNLQEFSVLDGLPGRLVNDILVQKDLVFIATNNGLVWFNTTKELINPIKPVLLLEKMWANQLPVKSLDNLSYKENSVKLELLVNSYKSRGEYQIAYRLKEKQTNWYYLPKGNNILSLPNLASGKYLLELKVINEDGISSNSIFRAIKISPPFWNTWWFILLVGTVLLVGVVQFYQQRIRKINERNTVLQQKNQLEIEKLKLEDALRVSDLSALKAQMNPHFIFNALNSIQEYILLNEKKLATRYLGKFADLMRLYLDMSTAERVHLSEEIKTLNLYLELENLRFDNTIKVELDIDSEIDVDSIKIPALLIQPYVENAFKHGLFHKKADKTLKIRFSLQGKNDLLVAEITDNGVGRVQSQKIRSSINSHKSFASDATQKRLELLNQKYASGIALEIVDLYDKDGYASGTQVKLFIPILLR